MTVSWTFLLVPFSGKRTGRRRSKRRDRGEGRKMKGWDKGSEDVVDHSEHEGKEPWYYSLI